MKPILLSEETIQSMVAEFTAKLRTSKLSDGGISYSQKFTYQESAEKVNVIFSQLAFSKLTMLLQHFSTEVAWHGVVERRSPSLFYITDVLVYPQVVTGSTVNTDQEAYQRWTMTLDDDTFNNLHAQMHSHVNMGTTPSSVDLAHQEQIVSQLEDDDFYLFMIWNKRMEFSVKLFDLTTNCLYEGKDVVVDVELADGTYSAFISKTSELVVEKKYTPAPGYTAATKETAKKSEKKTSKKDESGKLHDFFSMTDPDDYDYYGRNYNKTQNEWYRKVYGSGV